jgi:hypothetical protein
LVDQEQHDILQDTIVASDISLPTMYFFNEEGTLNSKGDHGQTLQDITIVSEVKEMECEFGNIVVSKTSPHLCEQVQYKLVRDDTTLVKLVMNHLIMVILSHIHPFMMNMIWSWKISRVL